MKGIILAAGMGTRLNSQIPKPLSKITNEKTILDFQMTSLIKKIGNNNILIVVGFLKDLIISKFPNLNFIDNENYQKTNTSKSLLLALKKIDDDIIWMNGDVYFDEGVLDILLNENNSCCLVDDKRCGDEEVKYSINQDGFIKELSKSVKNPKGEALGINVIRKKDLNDFRKELEQVEDNDYFEKALENLIKKNKLKLVPIPVGKLFCKEIDFKNDLEIVKKHVRK